MELMDRTVSVVMCTYNGERYLREQLDSIITQTYPVSELIIQDDCSTDGTRAILDEYAIRYSYIKIHYNTIQQGINANFISCIRKAKGDYIAISDQDDVWEPTKLETQLNLIGDCLLSSGFSKPFISDTNVKIHFDGRIPCCATERLMHVGSLPGHTLVIRNDFISKIPDVDKWLQYFMYDHLFQIVAAAYGSVAFCECVLVNQRRHLNAATYGEPENYQKNFFNMFSTIKRTFHLYRCLRLAMRTYFSHVYALLSALPNEAECKENARKMALYQSQKSFVAYLKLTFICVKLRHKIFYATERNVFLSVLRAIYFPISCSDYFRYLIDEK